MDTKKCSRCLEELPATPKYFYQHNGRCHGKCKRCSLEYTAEYRKKYPDRVKASASRRDHRKHNLMQKYGLTEDDVTEMVSDQNHMCALCNKVELSEPPAIDHCHKTGKIRALLCNCCNTGLGKFRDDPELLKSAIEYLEKHNV